LLGGLSLSGTDAAADPQTGAPTFHWGKTHGGADDPHAVTITEPVVNAPRWEIPVTVYAGDRVYVHAGGCVQTGGRGATWKRYVNPSGDRSWDLYHGEIAIPGTQVELLTPLNYVVGPDGAYQREFTATAQGFAQGNIALGYTDDGYSDNGYYAHDNGTENQCL